MSILFAQSTKLFMCYLSLEYHSLMYWVFDGIFGHVVHDQILETMINCLVWVDFGENRGACGVDTGG